MKKKIPIFKSDEEAEQFVETADLSEYDLSQFKPVQFEFARKDARVNMRLPEPLLKAVKARAKARGIPYQRFIREALEQAVARKSALPLEDPEKQGSRTMGNFPNPDEVMERLSGTLIADLRSLIKFVEEFSPDRFPGSKLGGLNFTLTLVSLLACDTLGFYMTGAAKHQEAIYDHAPQFGSYIEDLINKYFQTKNHFKPLGKVLSDFVRNALVHGFGSYDPQAQLNIAIFTCSDIDKRILASRCNGKKIIKINGVALAQDTIRAFEMMKKQVAARSDCKLLENIGRAQCWPARISVRVTNQFNDAYEFAMRHGLSS